MAALTTFIEAALELEEIDLNIYRSKELWRPTRARGVFGGQVVGQSLMAAIKTVPKKFQVHSLHSYFVKSGDESIPIIYLVNPIRNGKSFCTRTITAKQRGEAIFTCEASFQIAEESVLNHQWKMPEVPPADSLPSRDQMFSKFIQDPRTPAAVVDYLRKEREQPFPIDIRFTSEITLEDFLKPKKQFPAKKIAWMKTVGQIGDDVRLHQCVAAYATDHLLLSTSLLPAGINFGSPQLKLVASLDHCVWFHEPFRADEWMLYEMESSRASSGRGFTSGRLFTESGRLVVSCAQEGVIRINPSSKLYFSLFILKKWML